MKPTNLLLAVVLSLPATAGAVPSLMGYSGYLADDSGVPYTGQYDFIVSIYTSPSAGSLVFEETFVDESVDAGHFYLLLANNEAPGGDELELIFAANDELYLELDVEGTVLSPRQRLTAVPWALGSEGGGLGVRLQSIGTAACTDGEVLHYRSASDTIYCDADDVGSGGGGGDITAVTAGSGLTGGGTSGDVTLDVDFGTVAASSHTHSGSDITSGTVAFGRLPTGTTNTTVAVGNHTHTTTVAIRTGAGSTGDTSVNVQCNGAGKATGGGCSIIGGAVKTSSPLDSSGGGGTDGEVPGGWTCTCVRVDDSAECNVATAYAICVNE